MKTLTKEILGFNVPVTGICETLTEAITAAGSEAAVLSDYNANVLAHSHYSILRRKIVGELVKLTGVKLLTEKDGEKDVVSETEGQYLARLETELGEDFRTTYADKISALSEATPVDYKPGTRGSGDSAKPAAKWLAYYDTMVTEGKLDMYANKYNLVLTGDVETDRVAMANIVKEKVTAKLKAAAASALD